MVKSYVHKVDKVKGIFKQFSLFDNCDAQIHFPLTSMQNSKNILQPILLRDHSYITSANGLGRWVQKNGNFH